MKKMHINWKKLIISIVICQLAGAVGSIFTSQSVNNWYLTLQKPSFTPSGSIIGSVWIALFFLMGISLYAIWNKYPKNKNSKAALAVFGVQYILNILWSLFFFGMQNPLLALADIALLWLAIFASIITFYKVSRTSSFLFIPYILWVSFASYLNALIVFLN